MNWDRFRELYSKESQGWWDDFTDGTWKVLEENVKVGQGQCHPSMELVQFTKVAEGSDYSYDEGSGECWMIVSYGTPSDTVEYWKITGWESSYSGKSWNDSPVQVQRKTKTEVFYE